MRVSVDGKILTASVTEAEKLDALELALDGKKLVGWTAISGSKTVPATLQSCESFALVLQPQKLDTRNGARIDVACRNGEDMFTANAMTILVDTLAPYKVLWVGEGDTLRSENDACVTEHAIVYSLKGSTITDSTRKNKDGSCSPDGKPGKPKVKKSTKTIKL